MAIAEDYGLNAAYGMALLFGHPVIDPEQTHKRSTDLARTSEWDTANVRLDLAWHGASAADEKSGLVRTI